jgi:hypothetical protein
MTVSSEEGADALAASILAETEMEQTGDYLIRGRRFHSDETEALKQHWIAALTRLVRDDPADTGRFREVEDSRPKCDYAGLNGLLKPCDPNWSN